MRSYVIRERSGPGQNSVELQLVALALYCVDLAAQSGRGEEVRRGAVGRDLAGRPAQQQRQQQPQHPGSSSDL